jgi:hypothetical protein
MLLCLAATATDSGAGMYRWVDDKGQVHYGDSIPPQYANQGHVELSAQGRVMKRVEGSARSEDERRRRDEAAQQEANKAREAQDQRRRDMALLATFADEKEIDRARDRAIQQEQLLLDSLVLMRKQSKSRDESARLDEMIRMRQKNIEDIRARYEADKTRYRQIKIIR